MKIVPPQMFGLLVLGFGLTPNSASEIEVGANA
jgi:hypothetical protein